jgi:hypothetical protein
LVLFLPSVFCFLQKQTKKKDQHLEAFPKAGTP